MKKLKIISFGDLKSGCWKARIKRPLDELQKLGHTVNFTNGGAKEMKEYDIALFNNLFKLPEAEVAGILAYAKRHNTKVVYDTDDAQDLVPHFNQAREAALKVMVSYNTMAEQADLITTTTIDLAKHLSVKGNKPIRVMPNCLDPKDFPPRKRFKKLRIGYMGSVSHVADIALILEPIRKLQQKYDFTFVVFGFSNTDLDTFYKMYKGTAMEYYVEDMRKGLKRIKHEWHPWVNVSKYSKKIADLGLDIGLCPLEDNEFNSMKSCIKFYEYALVGTLAVASDVLPYSREPVMKAYDWYEAIEALIKDPQRREFEAQGQRAWVLENRDITKMGKFWEEAYLSILDKKDEDKKRTRKAVHK